MLRWGSDIIFLKVICMSLIAIALIFALILTNVFVDVDSFFMPKIHKKGDAEMYMTFDNEAKDDYNEKYSNGKSTIYRSKRSSNYGLQDNFKFQLTDKYNKYNMEITTRNGAVDRTYLIKLPHLNNKTDLQSYKHLNNVTPLETLVKLRPKRRVNYADSTTDKTNSNVYNNETMDESRHIDIEIKTHFDSKTTDSGRKQFINHLIDKIRRALRSDTEVISNQIENEPYFKTREQEPIVIAKKITFDSSSFPQFNDKRKSKHNTIQINKRPKYKNVKTGNKYVEDFQNSLERRFQKPIANNAENNNLRSELYPDNNSLTLLLNSIDGVGGAMDHERYSNDPSGQTLYYNGLDDIIKLYHNNIM